jgi:hypothetical protein
MMPWARARSHAGLGVSVRSGGKEQEWVILFVHRGVTVGQRAWVPTTGRKCAPLMIGDRFTIRFAGSDSDLDAVT